MINDDIIRMAREAGFSYDPATDHVVAADGYTEVTVTPGLERFATLVAAAEREACASIADAEMNPKPDTGMPVTQYQSGIFTAAEHIAAAIRARRHQ